MRRHKIGFGQHGIICWQDPTERPSCSTNPKKRDHKSKVVLFHSGVLFSSSTQQTGSLGHWRWVIELSYITSEVLGGDRKMLADWKTWNGPGNIGLY